MNIYIGVVIAMNGSGARNEKVIELTCIKVMTLEIKVVNKYKRCGGSHMSFPNVTLYLY